MERAVSSGSHRYDAAGGELMRTVIWRDRFLLAGIAITSLSAVVALRGQALALVSVGHLAMALLLTSALWLESSNSRARIPAVAPVLIWLSAGIASLLAWPARSTLILIAIVLAAVVTLSHIRQRIAVAFADLLVTSVAVMGISWFAAQDWAHAAPGSIQLVQMAAIAILAASVTAMVIYRQEHSIGAVSVVGILLLTLFIALGSPARRWTELFASLGILLLILGIQVSKAGTVPITWATQRRVEQGEFITHSRLRLIPSLLLAMALGMGLGHGANAPWHPVDILVVAMIAAALVVHQVMTIVADHGLIDLVQSQRRQLSDRLLHDPLTSLPNRDLFYDRLEHALMLRQRSSSPLAVIYLDIDDFKSINDRYGRGTGDALLVALADRISMWIRPGDTLARLAGDDFAILVDGSEDAAIVIAQRLQDEISRGFDISGRPVHVVMNIGVAAADDSSVDVVTAATRLVNRADQAMRRL